MAWQQKVRFINFSIALLFFSHLQTSIVRAQFAPAQQRVLGQPAVQQQQPQQQSQPTQPTQQAQQNQAAITNTKNEERESGSSSLKKEIYKCENTTTGGILYTDNPQNNKSCIKKTVEPLRTIQTLQQDTKNKISTNEVNPDKKDAETSYTSFKTILPPDAIEGINAGGGLLNLSVTFEIEPSLATNDTLQVLLDGKPNGQPSNSTTATITKEDLEPGPHTVSGQIIRNGQAIKTADAPTFHFTRNSLYNKNNLNNKTASNPSPPPTKP